MGVRGEPIANTGYCIEYKTPLAWEFARIVPFIHDTIVFMATSFALMRNSYSDDSKGKLEAIVFGKYLPAFSKSLLRDGQAYYLSFIFPTAHLQDTDVCFSELPLVIFYISAIMAYTLPFKTVTPSPLEHLPL